MLEKFLSYLTFNNIAPFGAGSPAALVLAVNLYHNISEALGPEWNWAAWIVAAFSMATMIWIEATGYRQAARALAYHEIRAALYSVLAALFCSAMVIYGISSTANMRALVSSLGYSVAGYMLIAIISWMAANQEIMQKKLQDETVHTQNQTALINAQTEQKRIDADIERQRTLQANAAARKAKRDAQIASAGQPFLSGGQSGQAKARLFDQTKLAAVKAYLQSHPDATAREIGPAVGLGKTAAAEYRNEANK